MQQSVHANLVIKLAFFLADAFQIRHDRMNHFRKKGAEVRAFLFSERPSSQTVSTTLPIGRVARKAWVAPA